MFADHNGRIGLRSAAVLSAMVPLQLYSSSDAKITTLAGDTPQATAGRIIKLDDSLRLSGEDWKPLGADWTQRLLLTQEDQDTLGDNIIITKRNAEDASVDADSRSALETGGDVGGSTVDAGPVVPNGGVQTKELSTSMENNSPANALDFGGDVGGSIVAVHPVVSIGRVQTEEESTPTEYQAPADVVSPTEDNQSSPPKTIAADATFMSNFHCPTFLSSRSKSSSSKTPVKRQDLCSRLRGFCFP